MLQVRASHQIVWAAAALASLFASVPSADAQAPITGRLNTPTLHLRAPDGRYAGRPDATLATSDCAEAAR